MFKKPGIWAACLYIYGECLQRWRPARRECSADGSESGLLEVLLSAHQPVRMTQRLFNGL